VLKKCVAGMAVAVCMTAAMQLHLEAQGRGGRGGRGGEAADPTVPTEKQWTESAEAQRHVGAAMKLAGTDLLPQAKMFCTATGPLRLALARQAAGLPPVPNTVIEPTRVFDNLYFIGMTSQNAWAITTSAGIILIDTMNSTEEARDVLVPSMKKVGLDPAQIKFIVISHGHPGQTDHTGGASYFQKTYGAKVLMNPADWALVGPAQRPERPLATPDMEASDGQKLTLGDTTLTLVHLSGHTPGTMGVIVPVKLRGTPHAVIVMGASQMPTPEALRQFEHVFNDFARPLKVEAAVNMHAQGLQDDFAQLETIRRDPNGPNPYLYGPERFGRFMSIIVECGRARLAAMGKGV